MKLWSAWLPDVLPHVERCPRLVAEHAIKRAAQRVFENSTAWIVRGATMPVAAGQSDVTIDLGDSTLALVEVEAAYYDGSKLDGKTPRELMDGYGDDWSAMTGTPSVFIHLRRGALRLWRTPTADAATGLVIDAAVMPSESSTGLPDDLFQAYRDTIALGARSTLMMIPKKPWTDLQLGAALAQQFETAIGDVNSEASMGHGRAQMRARAVWF